MAWLILRTGVRDDGFIGWTINFLHGRWIDHERWIIFVKRSGWRENSIFRFTMAYRREINLLCVHVVRRGFPKHSDRAFVTVAFGKKEVTDRLKAKHSYPGI